MLALYLTIWLAIVLFVAAEWGRAADPRGSSRRWPWICFAGGLALALVHTLLSFGLVHGWSHDDAARHTAVQTASVFGIAFGGGLYVNYAFFAIWGWDAWRWRATGRPLAGKSGWAIRAFYIVIIINAAVVFAAGPRRIAGAVLTILLAVASVLAQRRAALTASTINFMS